MTANISEAADTSSGRRQQQFRLAVLASLASRISGALAILITLPLVLKGLGDTRYAAFLAMTAATQWISPLGLGIMPALTREISAATSQAHRDGERFLFGIGFWLAGGLSACAFALSLLLSLGPDPRLLLGIETHTITLGEARLGFSAALGLVAINLFATLSTAIRAGYQESHVSSMLSFLANLLVVGGVLLLNQGAHGIAAYVTMLQAPLVLLMLADIARIVRKRRHLWPPISLFGHQVSMAQVRGLLVASGASWSLQISFFVQFFLSVVLVSRQFGAEDTNAYGTIMRVLILGNAVISLVAWPIIPAIADAASRGDRAWARRYSLRLLGFTFLVAAIGGALIAVAGPAAISIWLRGEVTVPSLMAIGFGLLFLGYNMAFAGYTLLMGLGLENGVGRVFLLEVAIGLCVAVALAPTTGASGFALAIGGASILFSGWLLPFRVFRGIRIDHVP